MILARRPDFSRSCLTGFLSCFILLIERDVIFMRVLGLITIFLAALPLSSGAEHAAPKRALPPPTGIQTPGVQIAFSSLKPELELLAPSKPNWLYFSDSLFIPNSLKNSVEKIDPKSNKPGDGPVVRKPCAGMVSAFTSLWVTSCEDGSLLRFDAKTLKQAATLVTGVAQSPGPIAASTDSVWLLTDTKTTLTRIDPDQNAVVGELRIEAGCRSLTFGETAIWLACPEENKVYRINAATNLVEKRIEVSDQPIALAAGEGSIWVLCRKDGKVERIDPKTDKVIKTIELKVPGVEGAIAVSDGSVWVTMAGFPLTRIDPTREKEKVAQQFRGEGGGAIATTTGAIWLSNIAQGTVWKIDPKRVAATLSE
jgi:virginiamycin B lyase